VGTAAAERGEEAVQDLAVETADGESSEQRADVDPDDALVPVVGSRLHVEPLQVPVDTGVDPDPQGAARQLLNLASRTAPSLRCDSRGASVNPTGSTDSSTTLSEVRIEMGAPTLRCRSGVRFRWCPRQDSNLRHPL
jgi:hypothetical protein